MNIKKIISSVSGSVLALILVAGVAIAASPVPSIVIDSIGGVTPTAGALTLNVNSLPTTVNIVGTGSIDQSTLDGANLTLSENGTVFYGPTNYWSGIGNVQTAPFTVPWTINAGPSQRTIVATITHGNNDGTDTVLVTLNINVNVNECKAAPAIAAELLKNHNVKPGSKSYTNYISQVAHFMGPQTDFNSVHACDTAAYRSAVNTYLNITIGAY